MRSYLLVVALLLVPAVANAADIPSGTTKFAAVASEKAMTAKIKQGIEAAVEDMSFITRPIARSRLKNSNEAFTTMTFKHVGHKLSIQHGDRKPVVSKDDGSRTKWTREDGETFVVTQKVSPNKIVQVFYAEDGTKTLTYNFSDGFSKLTVHVTLESPKLAAPMKYTLTYKKAK